MIKNENVEGEPAYDETYRRGPVVMRGPMIPKDNTYANLLAPEDSTDWLHADPWRVLRIQAEFVDGFGALAELGPAVTIFGSARTPKTDPLYKAARTVGRKIAQRGVAGITAGGPRGFGGGHMGRAAVPALWRQPTGERRVPTASRSAWVSSFRTSTGSTNT